MVRIYGKDTVTVNGSKVIIRQVLFHGSKEVTRTVSDIVSSARAWMRMVLPELRGNPDPAILGLFNTCFINPPDKVAAMNVVKAGLTTISSFIGREFAVKVREDDDAHGYVKKYYGTRVHLVGGVVQHDEDGDPISRRGEVHLSKDTVLDNPVLATITLIHEAGHKFANLRDFGDAGYFKDDLSSYDDPGLTWPQACRNADSYAVFTYKVMEAKFKTVMVHGKGLVT
jgi:hypothetical protein